MPCQTQHDILVIQKRCEPLDDTFNLVLQIEILTVNAEHGRCVIVWIGTDSVHNVVLVTKYEVIIYIK